MKVAFSSSTGIAVDLNFGVSNSFTVWEVGSQEAFYVGSLEVKRLPASKEEKLVARATTLADCAIVCSCEINGPAAAKLIARNIHPLRTGVVTPVEEIIGKLQGVLRGNPPPWIRKLQSKEHAQLRSEPLEAGGLV